MGLVLMGISMLDLIEGQELKKLPNQHIFTPPFWERAWVGWISWSNYVNRNLISKKSPVSVGPTVHGALNQPEYLRAKNRNLEVHW